MTWFTPKGNKLVGYFDMINVNDRELYDIKTVSSGSMKLREKAPGVMDALQVKIYATMLKVVSNLELRGIKVIYVGLGDKVCESFDVPFEDMTDFINNQADFLYKCLDEKRTPKGEPLAAWECSYCILADSCPDKISRAEEAATKAMLTGGLYEET